MPTPAQRKELVKLRVLVHLSDPAAIEFGDTEANISRSVARERVPPMEVFLRDMVSEGLIERRTEDGKQAKPYFITEAGRQYLDRQSSRALFPELSKKENWATTQSAQELGEVLAAQLRLLPEFRLADEDRIQSVGKMLAELATGKSQSV